jgi:hypothetical protein
MKSILRIGVLASVLAAFALVAASVSAGGTAQTTASAQQGGATAGSVQVNVVINRFVRQGRQIVAQGAVVARYQPDTTGLAGYRSATTAPDVTRKAFTARIATRRAGPAQIAPARICDVLSLTLGPLDLNLLGLMVHLDRVVLTIKADSNGGLLGSLFCSLAGRGATATPAKLNAIANRMTRAGRANGLNKGVSGFQLQVAPGPAQVGEICTILDLTLGPLDLNLLGLMIHLDRIHLLITAQRGGGILGDLLCGLAGSAAPAPPLARAGPGA